MSTGEYLVPLLDWPPGLELVLGSASPRRAELLATVGIPFSVHAAHDLPAEALTEARRLRNDDPNGYAVRLAELKALAVATTLSGRLVLGADTIVRLGDEVLEKPRDPAEAVVMLERLGGRSHVVVTGVALARDGRVRWSDWEATRVTFVPLSRQRIERYVATGEPLDKAGAYGIQGYGALLVRRIEGCYFNVMGLPLALLASGLERLFAKEGDHARGD